jgi:hypothetical protein
MRPSGTANIIMPLEPRRDSLRAFALAEALTAGRRLARLQGPLWAFYESGVMPLVR